LCSNCWAADAMTSAPISQRRWRCFI
jgi:hypothetical protein